ncbi:hypothetical protein FPOAC2_02914 [Fusarium poae]
MCRIISPGQTQWISSSHQLNRMPPVFSHLPHTCSPSMMYEGTEEMPFLEVVNPRLTMLPAAVSSISISHITWAQSPLRFPVAVIKRKALQFLGILT